jgi:hypothetical protein
MKTNRTIKGAEYNVPELVQNAIAAADSQTLNTESARNSLLRMGHNNPSDELLARYARESAILVDLARTTGANFENQIGKIDFSSTERAIAGVQSYLNRRIAGQHHKWTANHR